MTFVFAAAQAAQPGQHETDNTIRFFQWKVAQDPDDFFNYDRMGVAYIQKARETGDVAYYDLATRALEKSLDLDSTHPQAAPAKKHLATVYFANHRFAEAQALARQAIELNPADVTPYSLIGDAANEMGDYDAAREAYRHLQSKGAAGVDYLIENRQSAESFLTGNTTAAVDHMRRAAELSVESRMAKETIAWSYFTLGDDYFQSGNLDRAREAYDDALENYPDYHRAVAGLAKVAAAEGHLDDAVALYLRAIAIIPLPVYAAALGDVYAKIGKPAEAKKQYDLVEYIGRLNTFNRIVYNRELSAFYADHDIHPDQALELARKEFDIRHDIYTWDALAWALYRNDRLDEAAAAAEQALRLDTKDALLLFHAGMIYERLGDKEKAKKYLHRAIDLNPYFHLLFADVARATLMELASDISAQTGVADAHP
jgi:tetratricopeptide (TPR) repeat protein